MKKEIYIEKFKDRLDKWNAYLGKLERFAGKLSGEARVSFDKTIDGIKGRRDIVEQKLVQIKDVVDAGWNDMRQEAKEARKMLVEAFSKAHLQAGEIRESLRK